MWARNAKCEPRLIGGRAKLEKTQQNETLEESAGDTQALARRARVRFGRPPKEFAGEVEKRILDASSKVFLERGFEGASIDQIAAVARSGKPTICPSPTRRHFSLLS
jgi:Bacterial regulatory proteins, tetR family